MTVLSVFIYDKCSNVSILQKLLDIDFLLINPIHLLFRFCLNTLNVIRLLIWCRMIVPKQRTLFSLKRKDQEIFQIYFEDNTHSRKKLN